MTSAYARRVEAKFGLIPHDLLRAPISPKSCPTSPNGCTCLGLTVSRIYYLCGVNLGEE